MSKVSIYDQARHVARNIENFVLSYLQSHRKNPDRYPLFFENQDDIDYYWNELPFFTGEDARTPSRNRYFVDVNGVIYTVFPRGDSNFPGDLQVKEANEEGGSSFPMVQILGEYENGNGTGPRLVEDEYVLWDSLIELGAQCI